MDLPADLFLINSDQAMTKYNKAFFLGELEGEENATLNKKFIPWLNHNK